MFDHVTGLNPNKTFWQEVLLRVIDDALIGPTADGVSRTTRHRETLEARRFLIRPSGD